MTRSELIPLRAARQRTLSEQDLHDAVGLILQQMRDALSVGQRIGIRGFGSFTLVPRSARMARDPCTAYPVAADELRAQRSNWVHKLMSYPEPLREAIAMNCEVLFEVADRSCPMPLRNVEP